MAHTADQLTVRYGVPIKIRHVLTGLVLHSHNIQYKTGSQMQEVTCYGGRDDNDWWMVKGPFEKKAKYNASIGSAVLNGQTVRLEHLLTEKNLHSHRGFQSPSSHQGEVSGYGAHGVGDDNDNWLLEIEGAEPNEPLTLTHRFRLIHIKTKYALHSHAGHNTTSHQQEVTGYSGRDDNDFWQVELYA